MEISEIAYKVWEDSGRPRGRDKQHWFEAEALKHYQVCFDTIPGDAVVWYPDSLDYYLDEFGVIQRHGLADRYRHFDVYFSVFVLNYSFFVNVQYYGVDAIFGYPHLVLVKDIPDVYECRVLRDGDFSLLFSAAINATGEDVRRLSDIIRVHARDLVERFSLDL